MTKRRMPDDIENYLREQFEKRRKIKSGISIGNYILEDKISEGKIAYVFKGKDKSSDDVVALKIFRPDLFEESGSSTQISRFLREADILAKYKHPNVVRMRDFGVMDSNLYYVMDYIQGENLFDLVRKQGVFEPKKSVKMIRCIADALSGMHAKEVYHRDIKSENIMIQNPGIDEHYILIDFGLVKVKMGDPHITAKGAVVGTVEFIAPELLDIQECDARSDIYSLGACFYESLTGRLPLIWGRNEQLSHFLKRKQKEVPPEAYDFNTDIGLKLNCIVMKSIEKDPDKRYQSCEELIYDLDSLSF